MVISVIKFIFTLCSPGNQHSQKVIYFYIFSSKKFEIRNQSSIIKNDNQNDSEKNDQWNVSFRMGTIQRHNSDIEIFKKMRRRKL